MKFSPDTIEILKGFSALNPGIIFEEGNILRTISPQKDVMAKAKLKDSFEGRAAVYDLSKFIACLNNTGDPEITFGEDRFEIRSGRARSVYRYASENVVVSPPNQDFGSKFKDKIVEVSLPWSDIDQTIRSAAIFQLPDIEFKSEGDGKVLVSAMEEADSTTNSFDLELSAEGECDEFRILLSVDNLKLLPADYTLTIYREGVAHFHSERVEYWVAIKASN